MDKIWTLPLGFARNQWIDNVKVNEMNIFQKLSYQNFVSWELVIKLQILACSMIWSLKPGILFIMNTANIVKTSKTSRFVSYRDKNFIYETDQGFQFNIPLEDISGATLLSEDKTIFFMRWIRKQVELMKHYNTIWVWIRYFY